MHSTVKRRVSATIGGAAATAAIPLGYGVVNWKLLAGAAALGAVGGFFGVNIPAAVKRYLPKKKPPTD
jgi:nitrate/nitrite transporter NarK